LEDRAHLVSCHSLTGSCSVYMVATCNQSCKFELMSRTVVARNRLGIATEPRNQVSLTDATRPLGSRSMCWQCMVVTAPAAYSTFGNRIFFLQNFQTETETETPYIKCALAILVRLLCPRTTLGVSFLGKHRNRSQRATPHLHGCCAGCEGT